MLSRSRLPLAFTAAAASLSGVFAQTTGGKACVGDGGLLCITSTVNSTTTFYELAYSGTDTVGWMSIGFGTSMPDTPMVIMWANSDGTITLSQREATDYIEPTVQSSPARTATVATASSNALAAQPTFSFTIATDSSYMTSQEIIWAIGQTNPNSKDGSATIQQHSPLTMGVFTLDTSTAITDSSGSSNSTDSSSSSNSTTSSGGDSSSGSGSTDDIPTQTVGATPLTYASKLIIAHAVCFTAGLLFLLPLGALVARIGRVYTSNWFKGHWIIQFYIAAPVLLIGLSTGVAAVAKKGTGHLNDGHKRLGLVICCLYILQCSLGAIIHFVKSPNRKRRPPQNYVHAILGLLIIAASLAQVRTGYKTEWPAFSGRGALPNSVNTVWIVWVVLLPVLYFGGLMLLPRQFGMEKREREYRNTETLRMAPMGGRATFAYGSSAQYKY